MEVFVDLLPPSYTVKAEPSAKDSRRQRHQKKNAYKNVAPPIDAEQEAAKSNTQQAFVKERRINEDRRQKKMKRGRWLESRDRNDRRATTPTISFKI